jgi:outer membrane protein
MKLKILFLLFIISFKLSAQQTWNLKSCVEYAMAHSNAVNQSEIQAKNAALNFSQSKSSLYPTLSFGGSGAFNSGNNQDPTTFTRVTENYLSSGMQLQSSTDIFNFYSKRNSILANQWEFLASQAYVNKIKSDIALATANAYLQALLAKEQEKITIVQIEQTQFQLNNTQKLVEAGSLPTLNATQLEAQLASDSGNYIAAKGNTLQAVLALKSLMNIDAAAAFEIETPPIESIPVQPITELLPEYVYSEAVKNQPQQLYNEYKIKAALKNNQVTKASMYPTIGAFASLSSNYLSFNKRPIYNKVFTGYQSTGLVADAGGGVLYDVQSPIFTNGTVDKYIKPDKFFTQFKDNFRKSFGISVNVPILNGGIAKTNYERSLLNLQSLELQKQQDNQKLKQDIYQAYTSALTSLQRFNSSKKGVEANQKTYDFASKRFSIGALSTFDLISTQNNLLRSKLEYSINQFDFVFKMKVLEFYKGLGLIL